MVPGAWRAVRDARRLREITTILVRHGLGDAARRLGIARLLEGTGRVLHWDAPQGLATRTPAERLRMALEEMGPTFVKAGQILAGRRDLLPPEWTRELAKLHQQVAAVPFEDLRPQLEEDLGAPPEEVFAHVSERPLAAASIAQVHRARTKAGTEVVLKVRRPGIEPRVEADLRLLAHLGELLEANVPEIRPLRPTRLAEQLARSLRSELDLRNEARNAERLRATQPAESRIAIPRFHEEWTRERLAVMDFLDGPTLGQWLDSEAFRPEEAARVARAGAADSLRMIFLDGFFHADPHPGNVLLLEDGSLGLIDFGMVGRLSDERRIELLEVLLHAAEHDESRLAETLLDWCPGKLDAAALTADCAFLLDRYGDLALEELDVGELLVDVHALLRRNGLFLPEDVALLLKALVTLDGLGQRLDPKFRMSGIAATFARSALRRERSPRRVLRRTLRSLQRVAASFPRDLRRVAAAARRGSVRVEVEVNHLEAFANQLDRSANRITVGLVTAALIVGTSIALTVTGERTALGLPLFALLGFLSSLAAGGWLLISIWRAGRRR